MKIIETENFELHSHDQPEVGRSDGGHLVIHPKVAVEDRTKLAVELVIELALLTNLAGAAMFAGLKERGIRLGRINYQDNGNWKPELHVHLYGRAIDATYHKFGEPIKAARVLSEKVIQEPLNEGDISAIKAQCHLLADQDGYRNLNIR